MRNTWKKKLVLAWKGWGYSIFISILIATTVKSAIADWNIVPSGSMKPTIVEGDRVFVNKLAYDLKIPYTTWHIAEWGNPHRGDIVVFYSPADNRRLIKRVIGLPGDELSMRDNTLFINGEQLRYESPDNTANRRPKEQYCIVEDLSGRRHPVMITPSYSSIRSFSAITIPDGYYFMMGDNRDNSGDSRYFGFVGRNRIVGQATFIVASLDKIHKYRPRWERFFTKLP